jgi:hypothetical protein
MGLSWRGPQGLYMRVCVGGKAGPIFDTLLILCICLFPLGWISTMWEQAILLATDCNSSLAQHGSAATSEIGAKKGFDYSRQSEYLAPFKSLATLTLFWQRHSISAKMVLAEQALFPEYISRNISQMVHNVHKSWALLFSLILVLTRADICFFRCRKQNGEKCNWHREAEELVCANSRVLFARVVYCQNQKYQKHVHTIFLRCRILSYYMIWYKKTHAVLENNTLPLWKRHLL